MDSFWISGVGISGGEGEEDVAGTVAGVAAVAAQTESYAVGDALELRGNKWSVGGDDHDDRADVLWLLMGGLVGNFPANRNAGDAKLVASSVVALHQNADGVAAFFAVEDAGTAADAALEIIADHARSAADVAFFHGAGVGGVQSTPGVFGMDVESIDVIQVAIPRFSNNWKRPRVVVGV